MKTKIKVLMAALVVMAMACTTKNSTTETTTVDTTAVDSVVAPIDSTHTGVQQNDSVSVSE